MRRPTGPERCRRTATVCGRGFSDGGSGLESDPRMQTGGGQLGSGPRPGFMAPETFKVPLTPLMLRTDI